MNGDAQDLPGPLLSNGQIRVKTCRHGPMAYHVGDTYIGRAFDLYGEYAEAEAVFLAQLLKPGMAALDIGANIGALSIFMANAVGPRGAVLAMEPQRQVFQLLCANVALNALGNVYTYHAAAGVSEGTILVPRVDYAKGGNFGGVSLIGTEKGEPVPCRTIDGLALGRCDLIKIDVEGMENEVVAGAAATIGRFRPTIYLENDRRDRSEELLGRMLDLDYRVYWHLPKLYNPDNFFKNPVNEYENLISRNIICLPAERQVTVENLKEITDPAVAF